MPSACARSSSRPLPPKRERATSSRSPSTAPSWRPTRCLVRDTSAEALAELHACLPPERDRHGRHRLSAVRRSGGDRGRERERRREARARAAGTYRRRGLGRRAAAHHGTRPGAVDRASPRARRLANRGPRGGRDQRGVRTQVIAIVRRLGSIRRSSTRKGERSPSATRSAPQVFASLSRFSAGSSAKGSGGDWPPSASASGRGRPRSSRGWADALSRNARRAGASVEGPTACARRRCAGAAPPSACSAELPARGSTR